MKILVPRIVWIGATDYKIKINPYLRVDEARLGCIDKGGLDGVDRCKAILTITDEWVLEGKEPLSWVLCCELSEGHDGYHEHQGLKWRVLRDKPCLEMVANDLRILPHAGQVVGTEKVIFGSEESV